MRRCSGTDRSVFLLGAHARAQTGLSLGWSKIFVSELYWRQKMALTSGTNAQAMKALVGLPSIRNLHLTKSLCAL